MKRDSKGTIRKLNSCIIVFLIFIVSFSILFVETISSFKPIGTDDDDCSNIVAEFTYLPISPEAGEIVRFSDASYSIDPISTWSWHFGDDNSHSFAQNPSHIFNNPGTYTVTLRIKDIYDQISINFSYITVRSPSLSMADRPIANFTYEPTNPEVDEEILFTDTSTPEENITGWNWDFDDGTVLSNNPNPPHIYSDAGTYDVTLIVIDNNGLESEPCIISITVEEEDDNDPPSSTISASFTYEPTNPEVDEVVTFTDTSEYTGGEIIRWLWDFGDDSPIQEEQNQTYQYSNSGDYTVRLTVALNDDGRTNDTYETIITVGGDDTVDDDDDYTTDDDTTDDDTIDDNTDNNNTITIPDNNQQASNQSSDDDDDSENIQYNDSTPPALVTVDFDNVTSQVETGINLDNSSITSIQRINFTLNNTYRNVTLSVEKLGKKPDGIDNLTHEEISDLIIDKVIIYKYLNLSLTANNTYLDEVNMTIRFKVDRIWINNNINIENDINSTFIKLMRYHNGKWERLETELVDEDVEYLYYEAVTPGLSTFAVVGGHVTEIEQKTEEQDTLPITWELLIASIALTLLILFIILFKQRYIYLKK